MRVLFNNIVKNSNLSTNFPSDNYPVSNLVHPFLRRRYQSSGSPVTITVTFGNISEANCFFYGYHNTTSIELRFYDSSDVLLYTHNVSSPESGTGAEYFDKITGASYAEVEISGPTPVYVGGIAMGVYFELPRPLADFSEELIDNSSVSSSPTGQTQQDRIEGIASESYTLPDVDRDTWNNIRDEIKAVGVGAPLWIDVFYLNHAYRPPFYGRLTQGFSSNKNGRRFEIPIEFQEMK